MPSFTAVRKISSSAIVVGGAALVVAGCGGGGAAKKASAAPRTPAAPAAATSPRRGASAASKQRITVAKSGFGPSLFDGNRGALYVFTSDKRGTPSCYGACAKAWPPFVAKGGKPTGIGGAKSSLVGTKRRRDGTRQVTYKGQPVYYFADDTPGQLTCGEITEFGGLWLAVGPTGKPLR